MSRDLDKLQAVLGHQFADEALLRRALRHASAAGEAPSNQRLEFLGDAVVGLVIAERLVRTLPDAAEGEMTLARSRVVSRPALARAARSLGLPGRIEVDDGLARRKRLPSSIVADVYEAVVGAIYLDGGLGAARSFLLGSLEEEIQKAAGGAPADCKSVLQQMTQAEGRGVPTYELVAREGPDHDLRFSTVVKVAGRACGEGWGRTRQGSEQEAACAALDALYPDWRCRSASE